LSDPHRRLINAYELSLLHLQALIPQAQIAHPLNASLIEEIIRAGTAAFSFGCFGLTCDLPDGAAATLVTGMFGMAHDGCVVESRYLETKMDGFIQNGR
jgi:hypothetical protein